MAAMPRLLLGPLLRHIGTSDATIWVETDEPCEVEVLGSRERTFHVAGHHYAVVAVEGLEPGRAYDYEVRLSGEPAWPPSGSRLPRSSIRTLDPEAPVRLLFGSCRVAHPHRPPYTLTPDQHPDGHGLDSLRALTLRMAEREPEGWPTAMLLLGDQVYADEVPPGTLERIRARRDTSRPPGEEVADFEEYTWLYQEAWSDDVIRWFLSTVSTAMLFDDHDVHDDWNISRAWVRRMRASSWWEERVVGAFISYWIYQHLGNLSPERLAHDELYAEVRAADDAEPLLREFAQRSDHEAHGTRWSFERDFGRVRLLAIDCRAGRVLDPDHRRMVDDGEWEWIVDQARGDYDHLLLGMSDPYILPLGIHDVQAWNEAVCCGAWGRRFEPIAERIREAADLDHWASFRTSFERMSDLLAAVASGRHGAAPASVVALSGDVHNAYLSRVAFRRGSGARSQVYQATCSPVRNLLPASQRRVQKLGSSPLGSLIGRALARSAGVPRPAIRWRYEAGPFFDNQIASLTLTGRRAHLALERAVADGDAEPRLETTFERELAP
jgi:hypothetical protein